MTAEVVGPENSPSEKEGSHHGLNIHVIYEINLLFIKYEYDEEQPELPTYKPKERLWGSAYCI